MDTNNSTLNNVVKIAVIISVILTIISARMDIHELWLSIINLTLEERSQVANIAGFFAAIIAALFAAGAFIVAHKSLKKADESLEHQRIVSAWQILTNPAPGNSGKKEAIETLLAAEQSLEGIDLSEARHEGKVYLAKLQAENAHFNEAKLQGADLVLANLQGADLRYANLHGANLWNANLRGTYLVEANLQGAELGYANLQGANIMQANLQGANIMWAYLQGAKFIQANLQGAYLQEAKLERADFRGAILISANLQGTQLLNADLQGAKIYKSDISGANFIKAKNLDKAKWSSPNVKSSLFPNRKRPPFALETNPPKNLPNEFLERIELLPYDEYLARRKEYRMDRDIKKKRYIS